MTREDLSQRTRFSCGTVHLSGLELRQLAVKMIVGARHQLTIEGQPPFASGFRQRPSRRSVLEHLAECNFPETSIARLDEHGRVLPKLSESWDIRQYECASR